MVRSCDESVAPRATTSIVSTRDEAQDHENLLFSERILSLLLVVASLSLETRIVTELTVLELRGHAYWCGTAN